MAVKGKPKLAERPRCTECDVELTDQIPLGTHLQSMGHSRSVAYREEQHGKWEMVSNEEVTWSHIQGNWERKRNPEIRNTGDTPAVQFGPGGTASIRANHEKFRDVESKLPHQVLLPFYSPDRYLSLDFRVIPSVSPGALVPATKHLLDKTIPRIAWWYHNYDGLTCRSIYSASAA